MDRFRSARELFLATLLVHLPRRRRASGGRHRLGGPARSRDRVQDVEWAAALRNLANRRTAYA